MADTYTPEEINEIVGAFNRAIKDGTPITAEMTQQMKNAGAGVKTYTENLKASLNGLGKSIGTLAEQTKDGVQGASVFNDGLKGASTIVSVLASRFGIFGKVLGLSSKAAAAFAAEANKQGDALFKSYQDLTRFGQGTARGMDDVFVTMQKFSYGIGELDKMTALLRENSQTLAQFGGTVAQGTEAMANTANEFQKTGLQKYFEKMGVSSDNQNRAIAGYIKQLTNLGQQQGKTQAELTQGAEAYLKEMEGLTRLTGQTREEMEAQREEANSTEQFYATLQKMPEEIQNQMYQVNSILKSQDPSGKLARGFRDSISGFIGMSDEANQAFMATGGQNMRANEALKKGQINSAQYMNQFAGAIKKNMPNMLSFGELGIAGKTFGNINVYGRLLGKNFEEAAEAAAKDIEVNSELTDASVDLRQSQMNARKAFQAMIQDGVLPATKAMAALAGVTELAAEESKSFWDKALDMLGLGSKKEEKSSGKGEKFAGTQQEFYDKMYSTLLEEAKKQKIANPEAIAGLGASQSALETGYGKSLAGGNNYFGIKARPGEEGTGSQVTQEFINGKMVTIKDKFRKYKNMQESVADYLKFLQENTRYQTVLAAKTAEEAIAAQAKTGYATAPNYGSKLANIHASAQKNTTPSQSATASPPSTTGATMSPESTATLDNIRESQQRIPFLKEPKIKGANGYEGVLSGPTSGYRPNVIMHGTETLKIIPENQQDPQANGTVQNAIAQQVTKLDQLLNAMQTDSNRDLTVVQIDKLDRLIQVMQNQVNISQKILQQSQ